jgi:RNA polymerase sigma-70 factor (ECF subfamily)
MEATDEEGTLVSRSQTGDHAAFADLIRIHQRMIHSLAYRMTGSLADADDLAQETFVRAYRHLPSFRRSSKFSTWLYRIAFNVCLTWREQESRRQDLHASWSRAAEPEGAPAAEDAAPRVREALLRLPAKQRAAMILTVYESMNHAEAARALGCTEATVSWRVFAARRKLKQWLGAPEKP